ncbi:hypothetical protein SO802_034632 [Lithocarpus litseifolius]|uniref:Uncharacterized protein n=1 Tax=Lithocarpus litseifolius TaxID=425828 RepID=A0AAW2BH60_9ROSI
MWQSYILCGSRPDWLNQYNCMEASIASNCQSLNVQKCGLCHCYMTSLSDNCNCEARPCRFRSYVEEVQPKRVRTQIDSMLKDEGKRDVEYLLALLTSLLLSFSF